MKAEAIRQHLQDYIHYAKDEQLAAIYDLVKQQFTNQEDWWQQEEVITSLDTRSTALRNGSDEGVSWNDVKGKLLNRKK